MPLYEAPGASVRGPIRQEAPVRRRRGTSHDGGGRLLAVGLAIRFEAQV